MQLDSTAKEIVMVHAGNTMLYYGFNTYRNLPCNVLGDLVIAQGMNNSSICLKDS